MRLISSIAYISAVIALAGAAATSARASVLDSVKQRGVLNCGTDNTTPGFGYLNPKTSKMEGVDVDLCRATAAAVLGDPDKVNFVVVTDKSRFNAVQTGQVDIVYAHTSVFASRAAALAVDFLPSYFFDGGGVMVTAASGVKSINDLSGATICTTQGSGSEATLAQEVKARNLTNTKILTFDTSEKLFSALTSGRCNGMYTDKSALAAWRGNSQKSADYVILPETLAVAPFAGIIVQNDPEWRKLMTWTLYALFQAEEWGITSANLSEMQKSADPAIQKFLGVNGGFGADFHVSDSFIADMIKGVGNYGEIYDRSLGPKTPLYLERDKTSNALSKNGGLLYSILWL
ncbi:extracellular solute-binding protein family 3 (plasmid) [Rhizobium leguminosarum bv. trifolii WSM2304]|uniref:Extracellular solute-binding protein family 3 n=1 Tax=Rhizobium leguminosarum bv. trifolii (strain WSM2304) TaxID=395492 RepID=A0ABF7QV80_RHILW|nr:transporter substrate-binding domain-containing protein [Rhizobium leguminosarum]ACI58177.1 extracellular solute-binding protein family 3 [Rhizobium leguminosarum bv. trifolii WSM2304]